MTERELLIAKLSDVMDPENAAAFVDAVIQESVKRPTRDEVLAALRALQLEPDERWARVEAAKLLLKFINDPKIAEAFNSIDTSGWP